MSTVRIQVRRGTSADWTSVHPVLAAGEIGFETDTRKMKIGDGSTAWTSLDYISSDAPAIGEIAQDAINSALTVGDGISKVYDDSLNTITIENTGVLAFNTRTGEITLTDTDVNDALGYTAADAADLSGLSSQTASDIADAITTAENYTDSAISTEVINRNNAINYLGNNLSSSQISSALGYVPANVEDVSQGYTDLSQNITSSTNDAKSYTDTAISQLNTTGVLEGSNLYFTSQRVENIINSVTDTGLSYNNSTNKLSNAGVISLNVDSTQLKSNSSRGDINLSLSDNVSIVNNLSVAGDVTISGNLNIDGVTTTVNSQTLSVVDNLIYLNQPTHATVTAATHNGGTVDYTLDDIGHIAVGQTVVITGAVPAAYNIAASDNLTVQSIDNTKITVNKTVSVAYTSGGTVEVYAALMPDLGLVAGYEDTDNVHKHAGVFRDASTGEWKFFNGYTAEPGVTIDTTDSSFTLADVVAHDISGHNVAASGKFYGDLVGNANSASNAGNATSADKLTNPVNINGVAFNGESDITILASSPSKLNFGTGISGNTTGSFYDGSETKTISLDNTVVILDATQTLIHKTLTSPILTNADLIDPKINNITNGSAVLELPTVSDVLIGKDTTDTLTNKTISGASNTLSNIGNSSLTHSSISINGTSVSLGGSISNLATNSYADNAASSALSTAESYADTKKSEAISTSEGYTDSAISTEVTNRNSAIVTAKSQAISTSEGYTDTAIATEVTNRDSAISTATANIVKTTDTGSVTSTMIADGTIVNGDISSTAAIAATKIAGTAVTQADTGTVTSHMIANDTIVNADISSSAAIANSKLANSSITINGTSIALGESKTVTAAAGTLTGSELASGVTSSSLTSVGTLTSLAVTGDTTIGGNLTVTGTGTFGGVTVNGTTTTINSSNLSVSDSLIYLSNGQFDADALDIGFYGAYGTTGGTISNHKHTGLTRNHTTGEWYLFSNGIEASGQTVDLSTATLDTLKVGTLKGNVTGNVSGNADTATKLSTPRAINGVNFDGSAAITITAANPNALTIGTGLSGTSYTGSGAVTIAIDSTVATLTGTQTLTNKTLTSPTIATPTITGTLTASSSGITFSDATVQTTAGVPSLTTIATAVAANNTTYYPALDRDKMVPISGTYTLTIAPDGTNTAPIGTSVDFYQSAGTGAAFAAGSGVTILSTPGLKLRTTGSVATIMKTAANTWLLFGDLSA